MYRLSGVTYPELANIMLRERSRKRVLLLPTNYMMDQNLDPQFSIEDNKYEIAKGASKALPTLPSTVLNLPPMLHSV